MRAIVGAAAFCVLTACGSTPGASSTTSPSPSGSPLAKASGQLHAQVAMPPSFPSDVPIYPGARLTSAAGFPSIAPTSWGMGWETLDTVATVRAFYAQNMNKGDWTISFAAATSNGFAATFSRKSDSRINGTLAVSNSGGVTRIEMSLLSPSSS